MLGGAIKKAETNKPLYVKHTEEVVAIEDGIIPKPKDHLSGVEMTPVASTTNPIRVINLTQGVRTQITSGTIDGTTAIKFKNPAALGSTEVTSKKGDHIRLFWVDEVNVSDADTAVEVTISPSTFPGTYRVIGDTFMRSEKTGKDEAFQFIINKAKVLSEVTITLEAEGDPSTFEMQLNVLRSSNDTGENEMMKLVRYTVATSSDGDGVDDIGSLTDGL